MKTSSSTYHHVILLSLLLLLTVQATAQPIRDPGTRDGTNPYPYSGYSRFSSSLAIIIAVLVTSIFFMVFFFVYIRYCTTVSSSSVRQPVVVRATAAVRGLDAAVIDAFPTFTYSEVKDHKIGKEALECAVCLNEFEDDETLRLLPKCDHVFHPECIDAWLKSHVTCPVCRADLVPRPGERPMQVAGPTGINEEGSDGEANLEMGNLPNNDVVIQIDAEINRLERPKMNRNLSFQSSNKSTKAMDRNLSFGNPNKPPRKMMNRNMTFANPGRMLRSLTIRPRTFGRSRSAGNLLVQPGEDLERFTLRLPTNVRRDMIKRAALNRTKSFATTLADGSNRGDKIGKSDREVKSDRWDFFTRAWSFSLRSPRGVVERGESSGTASTATASRSLNKLRSFNCLEPRAADETGLMMEEPVKQSV